MKRLSSIAVIAVLGVLSLAAGACTQNAETADAHYADDISWFEGSIEEAFAEAKQQQRPVFLYWGAEWCPPCHYLKDKVFKRPEFIAKSREFVTVYLDGDTERAQILGEDLGVAGYPTVILFSPDGEEVMRMASSIPAEQYALVLDSAIAQMLPIQDVLARVLEEGPSEAARADLSLLAFYSWGQDDKVNLEEKSDSYEILGELLAFDDAFAGGNHGRLLSLETAYQGWNEESDREQVVGRVRDFVQSSCGEFPDEGEESQRSRCLSFLSDEAPA